MSNRKTSQSLLGDYQPLLATEALPRSASLASPGLPDAGASGWPSSLRARVTGAWPIVAESGWPRTLLCSVLALFLIRLAFRHLNLRTGVLIVLALLTLALGHFYFSVYRSYQLRLQAKLKAEQARFGGLTSVEMMNALARLPLPREEPVRRKTGK
jgi:hypothetical protein